LKRRSLQAAFQRNLDQAPDGPALAFRDAQGRFGWRSRAEVHRQAAGYAGAMAEHGVRRGDVCILALPSGERCATLMLSTLALGAVPLLVAPPLLPGRQAFLSSLIEHLSRKTGARLVVVPGATSPVRPEKPLRPGPRTTVLSEDTLAPVPSRLAEVIPAESDVAALQLTSGTTGFPRTCVWTHRAVLSALDGMARAMSLSTEDVCFNWTPLYHDMGLVNNFLLCLAHGVPLALLPPADFVRRPALWLRGLAETGATLTWSPNFGFALAVRKVQLDDVRDVDLSRVRAFWNAAERIHPETLRAFHERFAPLGVRRDALKTNYGCAENVGGATFSDPHGPVAIEYVDGFLLRTKGVARPVPDAADGPRAVPVVGVGHPPDGVRVVVLSPRGRPLPDGRVGEIALDTPSRMSEYLGDRRASRRALFQGLLRTGDLGYLRGSELFWVGRRRERITVRGQKLDPSDFERALLRHPELREGCFAAFGVDDPRTGTQRVVLAVEVRDATVNVEALGTLIRGQVHRDLGVTVDDLIFLPPGSLPKTSSGKRRHQHFRQRYLEGALHGSTEPEGAIP
jgi:acyl-CoA synthetase (AMP-forming)/AMP-acid ligase II